MDDEQESFLRKIRENPADDTVRLVYADWLEEHDISLDCDRCDKNGRVYSIPGYPADMTEVAAICAKCRGSTLVSNGYAERAEFIRVQCELASLERQKTELLNEETDWSRCESLSAGWCPNCSDCCCRNREESMNDADCPLHSSDSRHGCYDALEYRSTAVRRRAHIIIKSDGLPGLLNGYGKAFTWSGSECAALVECGGIGQVWHRGFVEEVHATLQSCIDHLPSLVRHPAACVTRVRVTDREPEHVSVWVGDQYGWQFDGGFSPPLRPSCLPEGVIRSMIGGPWFNSRELAEAALSDALLNMAWEANVR